MQRIAAFMLQRVGVALELQVLFRAEADAVYELLRLAETLADATRQALRGQITSQTGETTAQLPSNEEEGGGIKREKPSEISQTLHSKEAVQAVQDHVGKVLVSVQSFYGEEEAGERRKAKEFLQAVLAPYGSSSSSAAAAAAIPASSNSSRALLGEQLHRSRQGLLDLERSNEALASQVQELKEKIRGAEQNADRLNKQLLLLGRPQNSALAAAEEQQQREMQEQLRQLYIQYARRSAVCDTLTASVEAIAGRAEAAAAQNRLRLQEARQQLQLEQSAAASATDTQTNVRHTHQQDSGNFVAQAFPTQSFDFGSLANTFNAFDTLPVIMGASRSHCSWSGYSNSSGDINVHSLHIILTYISSSSCTCERIPRGPGVGQ
ncbi:uncharacterized protein EMH_0062510 [Eimeria mitis]|uniref:Uncharacterized protein n=1 Tax=Eimeria mitis TaxID=44415 RepID=U6JZT5_9EIME|nr:uncharacterized protein EMH_0062510 [Eimeria mitis]CDJ30929.1 hypothetical protein, conserved [Eimeria mitis]